MRCVIHTLNRVLHLHDMVMKWLTRNAPRPFQGWLCVPAAAVVLLIVLGVLQFRWLNELSSHDRERRHAHLMTDTRRFAAEIGVADSERQELAALVEIYRALGGGWQE